MNDDNDMMMDKGDVRVIDIPREPCLECGDETDGPFAAKVIVIDWRMAGSEVQYGSSGYCDECAERVAERLRDGLPERTE